MVGKNDNDFIANFLLDLKVKVFLKSANIWQSYERKVLLVCFLTHSVFVAFNLQFNPCNGRRKASIIAGVDF